MRDRERCFPLIFGTREAHCYTFVYAITFCFEKSRHDGASKKVLWARYNLWADDLPEDSLVVLEGNDLLIDTDAIARHVLRQSKARIIYQDRFHRRRVCATGDSDFETKSSSFSTRTIRTCNFHMLLVCVCLHVRTKCCCYYNAT